MKTGWILPLLLLAACASSGVTDGSAQPGIVAEGPKNEPARVTYGPGGFQVQRPATAPGQSFARELQILYLEQDFRWEARALNECLKREEQLVYQGLFLGAQDGWSQPVSTARRTELRPLTLDFAGRDGALRDNARFAQHEFDVVIVGDVQAGESGLDADAWLVLENYVIDGGGLILLSGMRAMPTAHWSAPAFARLAPVESTSAEPVLDASTERFCAITDEGWRSGLFDLSEKAQRNHELWGGGAEFKRGLLNGHYWVSENLRARAGAEVLARSALEGARAGEGAPLVVSRPLGRGRVLRVGTDDLHRLRELVGDVYFARLWANFIGAAAG